MHKLYQETIKKFRPCLLDSKLKFELAAHHLAIVFDYSVSINTQLPARPRCT